jgi:hypothetical protein
LKKSSRPLSSGERIRLIQKGNNAFNKREFPFAERIFRTAGYSDGLIRIGQHYYNKKEYLRAADIFKAAGYLKGEYACWAKLGLYDKVIDSATESGRRQADEQINKKLAAIISKMLAK